MPHRHPQSPPFPYTTLFRSGSGTEVAYDLFLAIPVHRVPQVVVESGLAAHPHDWVPVNRQTRSEEHTSELQSHGNLVCRLLLEKKNIESIININAMQKHHIT